MPTKVERSCPSMNAPPPHHHDHAARNNAHHKEALRLALGSILAPKRPHTPMSRSSSGSATPAVHHDTSHASSLGWPQLPAVGESAHAHMRPPGCSSLPHTHSHTPAGHSTHVHHHPQTPPAAGAHPTQTTHTHHRHPLLSTHPSHPSAFGRPDLTSSASSPSAPQSSQSQAASAYPHSLPPSLPHSHSHSPPFTPSHGHPLTPPHVLGHSTSPGHSSIPSGAVTPAVMTESSPSTTHSPSLGPSSVPEEEPLQMLPPLVAAGSTGANGEVHDLAQAVHHHPRSHPLPPALEADLASEMCGVHPDGRSKGECTQAQRAGFIQTLQSKNSAWDALIHGSFS